MSDLFSIESLFTLAVLVFLQVVIGFNNLLAIVIEARRAPPEDRGRARRNGVAMAIIFRLFLLFVLLTIAESFWTPLARIDAPYVSGAFDLRDIVFLVGGGLILFSAMKEISRVLSLSQLEADVERRGQKTYVAALAAILLSNLVFSFNAALTGVALSDNFTLLALAIVISGVLMVLFADHAAQVLEKNRTFDALGLFILLLVGVLVLAEGAGGADLTLFGHAVEPISMATFYFSAVVMIALDALQRRYQSKLAEERRRQQARGAAAAQG